jgi:hypothetical protein
VHLRRLLLKSKRGEVRQSGANLMGGRGEDEVELLFHSTRAREGDQRARRGSDLQPSATATSALARANIKGSWAEWA